MIPILRPGKIRSALIGLTCMAPLYFPLFRCASPEKVTNEVTDQLIRGKLYISHDQQSFIFIDTDSTFIINKAEGEDIALKEIGISRFSNDELHLVQGKDIEKFLQVDYRDGNSEKVTISISENILKTFPDMVISVSDTMIYE